MFQPSGRGDRKHKVAILWFKSLGGREKPFTIKRPGSFAVDEGAEFANVDERVGHGLCVGSGVERSSFFITWDGHSSFHGSELAHSHGTGIPIRVLLFCVVHLLVFVVEGGVFGALGRDADRLGQPSGACERCFSEFG